MKRFLMELVWLVGFSAACAALLFVAGEAAAADPRVIFRLYTSEVSGFVKTWQADPPAADSLWKAAGKPTAMVVNNLDDDVRTLAGKMAECEAVGIDAIPGMMLTYRSEKGFGDWVSRDFWTWRATQLLAIRKQFDDVAELRIHFDTENFAGTGSELTTEALAPHGGVAALTDGAKPFLEVFGQRGKGGRRWYPWICPAAPNDELIKLILDRVDRAKLLDEESFAQPIHYLTQTETGFARLVKYIHKHRAATVDSLSKHCPNVEWVPGVKQHAFHAWAERWRREALPMLGASEVWEFNDDKDAARAGWRPGREWTLGLKRSTLNDCLYFPLNGGVAGNDEWNFNGNFQVGGPNANWPAPRNPWVDGCFWLAEQRSLERAGLGHVAQSFTLAFDVYVPAAVTLKHQAIVGVWYPDNGGGHKEWLLRLTEGKLWLDTKQGDKTDAAGTLDAGWTRLVVRWDIASKRFTIVAKATTEITATPDSAPTQPLRLGRGTTFEGGQRVQVYGSELCVKNFHAWPRSLTAAEMVKAASAATYPY